MTVRQPLSPSLWIHELESFRKKKWFFLWLWWVWSPHTTVSSIPLSAFEFPMRLGSALLWMSVSLPLNWSDFVRQAGSFWREQKGIHQEEEENLNDGSSVNGSFFSFYTPALSDQSVIRSTHGAWRDETLVMNGLWRWIYINLKLLFQF